MNEDPTWLDEAAKANHDAAGLHSAEEGTDWWRQYHESEREEWRRGTRAVLAFAARQPRPITEAMVEAAWLSFGFQSKSLVSMDDARAALEAAEKARCK